MGSFIAGGRPGEVTLWRKMGYQSNSMADTVIDNSHISPALADSFFEASDLGTGLAALPHNAGDEQTRSPRRDLLISEVLTPNYQKPLYERTYAWHWSTCISAGNLGANSGIPYHDSVSGCQIGNDPVDGLPRPHLTPAADNQPVGCSPGQTCSVDHLGNNLTPHHTFQMNWVFNLWNFGMPTYGPLGINTCLLGIALYEREDRMAFLGADSIDFLGSFPSGACDLGAGAGKQKVLKWSPVHEIWHLLLQEDDLDPQPACPTSAIDQSVHYYNCVFDQPVGFSGWLGAEKIVAIREDVSKWED